MNVSKYRKEKVLNRIRSLKEEEEEEEYKDENEILSWSLSTGINRTKMSKMAHLPSAMKNGDNYKQKRRFRKQL